MGVGLGAALAASLTTVGASALVTTFSGVGVGPALATTFACTDAGFAFTGRAGGTDSVLVGLSYRRGKIDF